MKNKFKFLIASMSIAMLFLSSCEKEMYDDAIYKSQQPQNLSISKISFKELKSNKKAVEKIKSVISKKLPSSIANRAVYNEDFGVLIDTTNIVQITSATEQSLTFNIVDYTDSTKKENLILVSKNDGTFVAYIAEYNLTQQDLDILASVGTIENISPSTISDINDFSKAIAGPCMVNNTYSVSVCHNSAGTLIFNNGDVGNDCKDMPFDVTYEVTTIDLACLAGGGGGGTSSTSGTSGTSGTTGSTTGTGTTGSGPTGGSTNTGSNVSNSSIINTTYVPCTSCLEFNQTLNDFLGGLNPDQLDYWNDLSPREQQNILNYLEQPNADPVFVGEAINYLLLNPSLTWDYVLNNRTEIDDNQAEIDDYQTGGFDTTSYVIFNPQTDPWPSISPVIPQNKFVGWGTPGIRRNCMDYAKAQIAKVGYQISSYYASGQTFQIYTTLGGVNNTNLSNGLSYLKYALSNGIPVIVGVDDAPGHPGNLDNSTDHFIVIVGMGTNSTGNYFQFYDNASGNASDGASPLNLLYYDSATGIISGNSQTDYASNQPYPYIVTMIRKSKAL